jgi:hypothetical protein
MYFDTALVKIWEICRIVDKFGYLALPHLRGAVPKYEKKSIDGIGFS